MNDIEPIQDLVASGVDHKDIGDLQEARQHLEDAQADAKIALGRFNEANNE